MNLSKKITDLAEFLYLGYKQDYWDADVKLPNFDDLEFYQQQAWQTAASIAIQYLENGTQKTNS